MENLPEEICIHLSSIDNTEDLALDNIEHILRSAPIDGSQSTVKVCAERRGMEPYLKKFLWSFKWTRGIILVKFGCTLDSRGAVGGYCGFTHCCLQCSTSDEDRVLELR